MLATPEPGFTSSLHPQTVASYVVDTFEACVILWWRTEVSVEGARTAEKQFRRLKHADPNRKVGFITLLNREMDISTPPDARKEVARLLRQYDDFIGAAGIVYEGSGFQATAVRSIITAINLASRSSFPNKVFASHQLACAWTAGRIGSTLNGRRLEQRVRSLLDQNGASNA